MQQGPTMNINMLINGENEDKDTEIWEEFKVKRNFLTINIKFYKKKNMIQVFILDLECLKCNMMNIDLVINEEKF